jgi:hypothetical protein
MPLPSYSFPLATTPPTVVTSADGDLDGLLPFATLARVEATGDIEIPPRVVRGVEAIRLRVVSRLKFFKGEWFLDKRQGIPYFEAVFVKNPDLSLVQSIFRQAILGTPGVQSIARMVTTFNRGARSFVVDPLEIVLTGGVVFRAQPDEFIITLTDQAGDL